MIQGGVYESMNLPSTPGYLLAESSILLLIYPLNLHWPIMIPEAVYTITVASEVYPLGVNIIQEDKYYYMIASVEKAICDLLYKMAPVANQKECINLLFNDFRIDYQEWCK